MMVENMGEMIKNTLVGMIVYASIIIFFSMLMYIGINYFEYLIITVVMCLTLLSSNIIGSKIREMINDSREV